jgi:hypothetical protein
MPPCKTLLKTTEESQGFERAARFIDLFEPTVSQKSPCADMIHAIADTGFILSSNSRAGSLRTYEANTENRKGAGHKNGHNLNSKFSISN